MPIASGRVTTVGMAAAWLIGHCGAAAATPDFVFSPNISGGFGNYHWDVSVASAPVAANPALTLLRGTTYSIEVDTSGIHPFWIKTAPSIGAANAYGGAELTGAVNGTGGPVATFSFTPNASTPDTLYYDCGNHIEMHGTINVITNVIFSDNFEGL